MLANHFACLLCFCAFLFLFCLLGFCLFLYCYFGGYFSFSLLLFVVWVVVGVFLEREGGYPYIHQ